MLLITNLLQLLSEMLQYFHADNCVVAHNDCGIVTLLTGVIEKYCNERVCVCVSVRISP